MIAEINIEQKLQRWVKQTSLWQDWARQKRDETNNINDKGPQLLKKQRVKG